MSSHSFCNRLILEKAFSSDAPKEESTEPIHLCCCLSCPLHKELGTESKGTKLASQKKNEKKGGTENTCCIIPQAQQWPPGLSDKKSDRKNQQADKHSAICHWYDLLKILQENARKGEATTIFMHGLGPDLTRPLFPTPSPDIQEDSGSKFYSTYMSKALKREGVIRITFDGNESWSAPDIDGQGQACVDFHQMVSAACPSAICAYIAHLTRV